MQPLSPLRRLQERREEKMGTMMQSLRAACGEVGEDPEAALADVHPSLSCMW